MLIHASCAARDGIGVLITGRSGSGKSNLLLRLLAHGFQMVADDCVLFDDGMARAPGRLQGLIEVRGLGVYERSFQAAARVGLVIEGAEGGGERVAVPRTFPVLNLPLIRMDLLAPATPDAVSLVVACLAGRVRQIAGPL